MQSLGWVAFGTAMMLVVLHRNAAREYLAALERRYGHRDPGASWLVRRDPDPVVERLRRRRLLFAIPASILVMTGIVLLAVVPG